MFRGGLNDNGDPKEGGPAYIPKRNFALAVLDRQGRGEAETDPVTERPSPAFALAKFFEDADSGVGLSTRVAKFGATADNVIGKITNETVKTAATNALTAAVGELKTSTDVVDTAIKELEGLFDSTMDRASGWFKVNAQRIALVIGVVVALVLNVDTIHVGKQLWANEDLRARAVAAADAYYTTTEGQRQLTALCVAEATENPAAAAADGAAATPPTLDLAAWQKVKDCTEREIREATSELAEVGYPIGWTGWEGGLPAGQPDQNLGWAIVGILITGLALSSRRQLLVRSARQIHERADDGETRGNIHTGQQQHNVSLLQALNPPYLTICGDACRHLERDNNARPMSTPQFLWPTHSD